MFQDLPKMTASQRSTTHDHVVEPLPNVPASVISLFPNHDMPNLFKLTRSAIAKICNQGDLRNGGNEHAAAATAAALMTPSCCRGAWIMCCGRLEQWIAIELWMNHNWTLNRIDWETAIADPGSRAAARRDHGVRGPTLQPWEPTIVGCWGTTADGLTADHFEGWNIRIWVYASVVRPKKRPNGRTTNPIKRGSGTWLLLKTLFGCLHGGEQCPLFGREESAERCQYYGEKLVGFGTKIPKSMACGLEVVQ